jgi:transposase-like protein
MISEVMAAEVHELCGPKHLPAGGDTYRAGSSPGRVLVDGEREEVTRPRVRRQQPDGSSQEVPLATYRSACDPQQLQTSVVTALTAGVSTRDLKAVQPNSPGVGKSNVSRLWKKVGHEFVDKLRSHDLSEQDWLVLMLDGIRLSKEQLAVVAIGITIDGHKRVLDFELGSTENAEVCRDLMRRVMQRGFHCQRPLLAVLDGSEALRTAVRSFFPDAVVQRCLVHKEKNIQAKLSRRHWGELARSFRRLREVQGKAAAQEVVGELQRFLQRKNAEAFHSLCEAGDELIALHSLDVPSTLHRNLLSTNAIENSFRNTRRKLGRVTRFRAETDQATRWLAFALTEVEKGFHRLSGYKDLPHLAAALEQRRAREPVEQPGPFSSPTAPTKAPARQVATTNVLP